MAQKEHDVNITAIETGTSADSPRALPSSAARRWWLWEFSAWLVSVMAVLAVVGFLLAYSNKPAPSNLIHGLERFHGRFTINSYVSITSTVFRLSLAVPIAAGLNQLKWTWFRRDRPLADYAAIDSARGLLGALTLLWRFRARHLVSLGAFIVATTIVIDLAFQTLVTYPSQPRQLTDGVATTFRAQNYNSVNTDEETEVATYRVDATMLGAINTGLYSTSSNTTAYSPDIVPTCSTGNCTWKTYTSLGICSRCADISSQIQQNCSTWTSVNDNMTRPYCQYSLPEPGELTISGEPEGDLIAGGRGMTYQNITASHNESTLVSFRILRGTWVYNDTDVQQLIGANATECSLFPCVKKFHTEVINGTITDEALADPFYDDSVGPDIIEGWVLQPPDSFMQETAATSPNFTMSYSAYYAIQLELEDSTFTGASPAFSGQSTTDFAARTKKLDLDGLVALMEALTTSMTTTMRGSYYNPATQDITQANDSTVVVTASDASVGNGNEFYGVASQNFPIVTVQWYWLFVPVTVLLLTLIFLVLTIIVSSRDGGAILWKGDSMATFCQPLTADARFEFNRARLVTDVDKIAEGLNVRWIETDKGWRLAKARDT